MNKKGNAAGILILIIIIVLVWGFIGGQQAQQVGVTCDRGLGDSFCWKWHTNAIGQVQEGINDVGDAIKDFFDN